MEWVILVVAVLVAIHLWGKIRSGSPKPGGLQEFASLHGSSGGDRVQRARFDEVEEQVVEIVTSNGEPAFKYRFQATLDFHTPSDVLKMHRMEEFIERPGGNRDAIQHDCGWWLPVSRWERPADVTSIEDERFKYIGGAHVYIELLLAVRAVYEDKGRSPQSKRDEIRRICELNKRVYAARPPFQPPWQSLIVPALSLAEGFGPHRLDLLDGASIRSIYDVENRSDKELLAIKGIGKSAVAALRAMAASWGHDKFTEWIEVDEQYR